MLEDGFDDRGGRGHLIIECPLTRIAQASAEVFFHRELRRRSGIPIGQSSQIKSNNVNVVSPRKMGKERLPDSKKIELFFCGGQSLSERGRETVGQSAGTQSGPRTPRK